MRTENEIRNAAVNLKARIVKRSEDLLKLKNRIDSSDMGIGEIIKPRLLASLKMQLEERVQHNLRDRSHFAVLRWVLGITEDIDTADLELDV